MTQKQRYEQFTADMEEAGYEVTPYRGKFSYEGPAVRLGRHDDLQDVIRSTRVKLQWDNLGLGYVVYPK